MADEFFGSDVRGVGAMLRAVPVRVRLDAANDGVLLSNPGGLVLSCVHTATGLYTFNLKNTWRKLRSCQPHYAAAGDTTDLYAQADDDPGNLGSSTPVTMVVRLKTGDTNTDPPATPNGGVLDVLFLFEDSGAYA
jgi:hypothetical protein